MGHPHKCCSVKKTGRKSGSFRQTDIQSAFSGSSVAGKDFSEPDLTEGTYSFKGDSYTYTGKWYLLEKSFIEFCDITLGLNTSSNGDSYRLGDREALKKK